MVIALFFLVAGAQGVAAYRQYQTDQNVRVVERILDVGVCAGLKDRLDIDRSTVWTSRRCLAELHAFIDKSPTETLVGKPGPPGPPGPAGATGAKGGRGTADRKSVV